MMLLQLKQLEAHAARLLTRLLPVLHMWAEKRPEEMISITQFTIKPIKKDK